GAGDRLLGLYEDASRFVGPRTLQPALSLGLRGPRTGPAGPQPAAHGAGLVDVAREPELAVRRDWRDYRISRGERRGAGVPVHRQPTVLLGPGKSGLSAKLSRPRLPQGVPFQTADRLFGARPATGNLSALSEPGVPDPTAPVE